MDLDWVLKLHLATTIYMTGVIWFVQIVHYPLMALVGADNFSVYEESHRRRTFWVVGPAMLVEAISGAWLVRLYGIDTSIGAVLVWLGMLLIFVNLLVTACVSVPAHGRLAQGYHPDVLRWLVLTNWIRTTAWTLRSLLVLALL
ncbi:MAG: hypothetical protein C0478_08875 [Planctomyces sp.]|nr:hypothetical protein [Planctomyces sp.]